MSDPMIQCRDLGMMFKLYRHPRDRILDALGLSTWMFWKKEYYQLFWALRGLNLTVNKGERVGIIGRNGAGKSTLLKIISGNMTPTEGAVEVKGEIQALLTLGTGFHPEFTGRENIAASLAFHGYTSEHISELEEEIVDFAELDDFIDQPVKTYSAGMYARLAFSCATAIKPEILIIDEVLGAGDAYFAGKCVERMQRLTIDSGATILFVSHDMSSVQRLCERAIWIERGQLKGDGRTLRIVKDYTKQVRHEENLRLKARDMRVLKKQAAGMNGQANLSETFLFHFVGCNGHPPSPPARIYSLRLLTGARELGAIQVGSPMDNAAHYLNYVIDTPGYMDWGKPESDTRGAFRPYGDYEGRYCHAPFQFTVPKVLLDPPSLLQVEVTYSSGSPFALEWYDGQTYCPMGVLGPHTCDSVVLGIPHKSVEAPPAEITVQLVSEESDSQPQAEVADEYGDGEAKILSVRLLDADGDEKRVFEVGDPMSVEIRFTVDQPIANPYFVFCAYLPDGRTATQWIASSREVGVDTVSGKGAFRFEVDNLLLGRSHYVASVGIFKRLRPDGLESESYHVLDRCIHFEIVQKIEQPTDLGLCVHPFQAELADEP